MARSTSDCAGDAIRAWVGGVTNKGRALYMKLMVLRLLLLLLAFARRITPLGQAGPGWQAKSTKRRDEI